MWKVGDNIMARELRRKSIHLLGLVFPILYVFTTRHTAIIAVGGLLAIVLGIELLKAFLPAFQGIFVRIFSPILRSQERRGGLTGATYYLIGSFLCILLFDKTLAIVCLCFLTLGDLFAALIGKQWGRIKLFSQKSLEGSLACFVVCTGIALLIGLHPVVAVTGALVATLIELLPLGVDDNVTIPLISGLAMHLLISSWQF